MKNLYSIAIGMLLTTGAIAQNGNIPNGGFENWTTSDIYDYPTQWRNSNEMEFRGQETTSQSTDAQDGTYSVELSAFETAQNDTASGYVFHGQVGQNGPEGGIPYTAAFDEVRVQFKSSLQPGDSVIMVIFRSLAGIPGPMQAIPVTTTSESNWTQASMSVGIGTQDSLFIGFILGSVDGNSQPDPTSWVRLDNVQMFNAGSATTDVPDPSFEDWSTLSVENADDWYSMNELLAPQGLENAIKTIDANTGSFAIEMSTILDPDSGDTINSFASLAPIDFFAGNPFSNIPYNATPTTFSGAYKYAPANGDQAAIQMIFYAGGLPVGTHTEPISNSPAWQTFSSPLTISGTPDSLNFIIYSGDNPGSVLKLDDLALSGGDVSLSEFETMSVSMYPNPATSSVMIKAEGNFDYLISDMAGNIVKASKNEKGAIQLDISDLTSGAYVVKINNAYAVETLKLIVE